MKNIVRISSIRKYLLHKSAFYFIRKRLFRTRSHSRHTPGFLKPDKFQYDSFEAKCLSRDIQKSNNIIQNEVFLSAV